MTPAHVRATTLPPDDPKCQTGAILSLSGIARQTPQMYEAIGWEGGMLRVINCRTETKCSLRGYEVERARLIRPAPVVKDAPESEET